MSFEDELSKLRKDFEALEQASKEECEKKGGKWNPETKKCTLPQSSSPTKEECEKKGGKWVDGKCEMPSKETFDPTKVPDYLKLRFKEPMIDVEKGEIVEEFVPAYGAPPKPTYAPPAYPAGLYPVPKLRALIEKLAKQYGIEVKGTLEDLLKKLGAPQAITKEECEAKGGKWEDGKCKMPEKKESIQSLGILPSSLPQGVNLDSMTPKQIDEYVRETFPKRWEKEAS